MPRLLRLLAALVLPVLLTGCLDYREHLTLHRDGSGTLQLDFKVDLGLMGEISQALGEKPDPESMQGPSRQEILQGLDVKGIKVKEIEIKHKGTKSKVHLVIEFENLRALGQIEGFGDDRRIDFFDKGDKAWVVYSFDTKDVIPIEEFSDDPPPPGEKLDPIEQKILAITRKAKARLRFKARITMPGAIHSTNGEPDAKKPKNNEKLWVADKQTNPKRHARLGRGKIWMRMLVDKSSIPFVKRFRPMPKKRPRKR